EIGVQRPAAVVHAGLAGIEVAPRVEQVRAEATAADRLQELLRNDRVGVYVGAIERRDDAAVNGEASHDSIAWQRPGSFRRRAEDPCPCRLPCCTRPMPRRTARGRPLSTLVSSGSQGQRSE